MKSREATGGQGLSPGGQGLRRKNQSPTFKTQSPQCSPIPRGWNYTSPPNSRKAPLQAAACLEPHAGALCLHIQENWISHNHICDKGLAISNVNEDKWMSQMLQLARGSPGPASQGGCWEGEAHSWLGCCSCWAWRRCMRCTRIIPPRRDSPLPAQCGQASQRALRDF